MYGKEFIYREEGWKEVALESLESILKNTRPGKKTDKNHQFLKLGNFNQTLQDFEGLGLNNISDLSEGKKMGFLPDGSKVIARPSSTAIAATLEIQFIEKRPNIKIRYIESWETYDGRMD